MNTIRRKYTKLTPNLYTELMYLFIILRLKIMEGKLHTHRIKKLVKINIIVLYFYQDKHIEINFLFCILRELYFK